MWTVPANAFDVAHRRPREEWRLTAMVLRDSLRAEIPEIPEGFSTWAAA